MTKNFFCIRGYMKSGTNWLGRILNCHPEIQCIGEFHWETFFQALAENVGRIAPSRRQSVNAIVRPELQAMVQRCLSKFAQRDCLWIGDRSPTTIAPIVIADAPQIVIQRDFRDVIVSRMFHLYNNPRVTTVFDRFDEMQLCLQRFKSNRWFFRQHPEKLLNNEEIVRDSAKEWRAFLRDDRKTIAEHPDLPVLQVRYENLHQDFHEQVDGLFGFLGLKTPELSQDALPGQTSENPDSARRKGQIGDWRNYMTDAAKSWINDEILEEMMELGYTETADW